MKGKVKGGRKRKCPRGVGIRDCRRLTQGFKGARGKDLKERVQGVKGSRGRGEKIRIKTGDWRLKDKD
jgi:hypothetical protein